MGNLILDRVGRGILIRGVKSFQCNKRALMKEFKSEESAFVSEWLRQTNFTSQNDAYKRITKQWN